LDQRKPLVLSVVVLVTTSMNGGGSSVSQIRRVAPLGILLRFLFHEDPYFAKNKMYCASGNTRGYIEAGFN
jgi:hypothetical protein